VLPTVDLINLDSLIDRKTKMPLAYLRGRNAYLVGAYLLTTAIAVDEALQFIGEKERGSLHQHSIANDVAAKARKELIDNNDI
jgi:hypothetical protein